MQLYTIFFSFTIYIIEPCLSFPTERVKRVALTPDRSVQYLREWLSTVKLRQKITSIQHFCFKKDNDFIWLELSVPTWFIAEKKLPVHSW